MYRFTRGRSARPTIATFNRIVHNNRKNPDNVSILQRCSFHNSRRLNALTPYRLADIGEGITECRIVSWSVKPGDYIQQFDPICEVQSDKATVEITSRFEGTIKTLHYEVDDMAPVGSALVDIETENADDDHDLPDGSGDKLPEEASVTDTPTAPEAGSSLGQDTPSEPITTPVLSATTPPPIATPAVRHILKDLGLNISAIVGTGKGGRVLKEDVQRHAAAIGITPGSQPIQKVSEIDRDPGQDRRIPLSLIQTQMFHSMTRSLSIPHLLYTHTVDLTDLTAMRKRTVNDRDLSALLGAEDSAPKLSVLPFVLKALSQAVTAYPTVNSILDTENDPAKPHLVLKAAHNFGVAVDTPNGLLVPVVRNVQDRSIISIAAEISRLSTLAKAGRLSPNDMTGATLVVSNIGSIGGDAIAPVILSPMTAILAIGRATQVPAFATDIHGQEIIVKKEQVTLSWSADHRVLDGATVARCAQSVGSWLENIDALALTLK
ncbi:2-oxoacid dehydrogenases acyltransferase-domain-containing protein [Ilyonectria sp. MPI-CAGE-AT-0026]|nr:2-oxoacid dehydrogenases acyltransferase-domain-containing protein [Ilyonectria sp. MPI-CAGE-AT-0026]